MPPLKIFPEDLDKSSVRESRVWVKENRRDGCRCPACRQVVAERKRHLHHSMARALLLIFWYFQRNPGKNWLHVESYLKHLPVSRALRGDFAKLRFWGLIEKRPGAKDDGNPSSGYYAITAKGKKFVRNEISVPPYFWMFNGKCRGFAQDEEEVYIKDVLQKKFFNYDKLMNNEGLDTG